MYMRYSDVTLLICSFITDNSLVNLQKGNTAGIPLFYFVIALLLNVVCLFVYWRYSHIYFPSLNKKFSYSFICIFLFTYCFFSSPDYTGRRLNKNCMLVK